MVEDTRGRGNALARGIGLGVSMGSLGKGSPGKKSYRETKDCNSFEAGYV
jgi:hypothetical protein